MRLPILVAPAPRLYEHSLVVHGITTEIEKLAQDMLETLYAAQGLGLSAVQVGRSECVAVIDIGQGPEILINPVILDHSRMSICEEGCLSVPDVIVRKPRWLRVTYRACRLDGTWYETQAEDLFAIVLQHEIDHLNGSVRRSAR